MIDKLILRMVILFVFGFLPIGICLPLIESIKNKNISIVVFLLIMVWLVYLNAWSKRACALKYSESISFWNAWSKSRIFLNTDIMTKLAFLPLIGFVFDNWINRNNPSYQDDRVVRANTDHEH